MLASLLVLAFVASVFGGQLDPNAGAPGNPAQQQLVSNTATGVVVFPAGLYNGPLRFSDEPVTTCQGIGAVPSSSQNCIANPSYAFDGGSFSVSGASTINTIDTWVPGNGIVCSTASGCPQTLPVRPIKNVPNKAKAIWLGVGQSLTLRFPKSAAIGFNGSIVGSNSPVILTAQARLCDSNGLNCLNQLSSVNRVFEPSDGNMYPVFFTAPEPFWYEFNTLVLSNANLGATSGFWLILDDFFWGRTGINCVGYESSSPVVLAVNLTGFANDLTVQITDGNQGGTRREACSIGSPTCKPAFFTNTTVLFCVRFGIVPRVVINDHGVQYDSGIDDAGFPLGAPGCVREFFGGPPFDVTFPGGGFFNKKRVANQGDNCGVWYLDPRALLEVPAVCWPQADMDAYSRNGFQAQIHFWQLDQTPDAYFTDGNPLFSSNKYFRSIAPLDPQDPYFKTGGWPAGGLPKYVVLALPDLYVSVSWVGPTGIGNPTLSSAFSAFHDCTKHSNNFTVFDLGTCASYEDGELISFDNPVYLTKELVVRAQCSEDNFPVMAPNVTLYIQGPIDRYFNFLYNRQYVLDYSIPNRGGTDTRICVISSGEYDVTATECNAAGACVSTPPQVTFCEVDTFSICNGFPLDVVGEIRTNTCTRAKDCLGNTPPPYPVPYGLGGVYNVNYIARSTNGQLVTFRTTQVDPNNQFYTCVLNLNNVTLAMPVVTANNQAVISGRYDCSTEFRSGGNCTRLDVPGDVLDLFSVHTVPLACFGARSINYAVDLATSTGLVTSVGRLAFALTGNPNRCQLGGVDDRICVPAVGSPSRNLKCGDCAYNANASSYRPQAIQIQAEECGLNPSNLCLAKRDEEHHDHQSRAVGNCITATQSCDCREGSCDCTSLTQDLCVWDTLYLPVYTGSSTGVVVELLPPLANSQIIRNYTNQGGFPQTYCTLAGLQRVRITDNPPALPVFPIPGPVLAPTVVSGNISCTLAATCSYNDFLSVLDVSGDFSVDTWTSRPDDGTVRCSAITYFDSYSTGRFRQVLNNTNVALSVNGRVFRPNTLIRGCRRPLCEPEKTVVLRTTLNSYTLNYTWAGIKRTVTSINCLSEYCEEVPCLVRWAPVDQTCPELYKDRDGRPWGLPAIPQFQLSEIDWDSIVEELNETETFNFYRPGGFRGSRNLLSVNNQTLCNERIYYNYLNEDNSVQHTQACRAVDSEGFMEFNQFFPQTFERFFVMAADGSAPITAVVTVGCATVPYVLDCQENVTNTGIKNFVNPYAGRTRPRNPCLPNITNYWHQCRWVVPSINPPSSLTGLPQYWPSIVSSNGSCLRVPNAPSTWAPWVPLRPFVVVGINLEKLTDGHSSNRPLSFFNEYETIAQEGYMGDCYVGEVGEPWRSRSHGYVWWQWRHLPPFTIPGDKRSDPHQRSDPEGMIWWPLPDYEEPDINGTNVGECLHHGKKRGLNIYTNPKDEYCWAKYHYNWTQLFGGIFSGPPTKREDKAPMAHQKRDSYEGCDDCCRRNPFDLVICCGSCGSSGKRSLLSERASEIVPTACDITSGKPCTPLPPQPFCANDPWRMIEVGGKYNLVCVLANGEYKYTVQELFREERRNNFKFFDPQVCPKCANEEIWNRKIINCRPSACYAPPKSPYPVLYTEENWAQKETMIAQPTFWKYDTASTNFVCQGGDPRQSNVLLRPNLVPYYGDTSLYLKSSGLYQFRCNSEANNCVSQPFNCAQNVLGTCIPPQVQFSGQKRNVTNA